MKRAVGRLIEVAVLGVIRNVLLEELDFVSLAVKRFYDGAIGCGVAIPPR
jgi:hypothetical protein